MITCLRRAAPLVAVLLVCSVLAGVPATAAPLQCSSNSSSTDGVAPEAHPVVLVHGWRGKPMTDTRTQLERRMRQGWQYLLFDYHSDSDEWASSEEVSGCLANYLLQVSRQHSDRGGDGRVYVVAHSMGGLALRFAVQRGADDPQGGPRVDISGLIGGLTTLDTPHQGAPWGQTAYSDFVGLLSSLGGLGPIPEPNSRASRCLASHQAGQGLPNGCAAPPYLPSWIPVHQVEGAATVTRTLFGWKAYDMVVGGDGVVPSSSSAGYLGSASGPTVGRSVSIQTVACSMEAPSLLARAGAKYGSRGGWAGTIIGGELGTLAQLWLDGKAFDALQSGRADGALLELFALTYLFMPCGHDGIQTASKAMDSVVESLRAQARARPVTEVQMRGLTLPRTHGCGFAAPNGEFDGATLEDGYIEEPMGGFIEVADVLLTDLDGDRVGDGIAHLVCSSGHAGTTSALVVRTATGRVFDLPYTAEAKRALPQLDVYRIQGMRVDGDRLLIDADGQRAGDATCCPSAVVEVVYELGPSGPHFGSATDMTPDPSGGVVATDEGFGPVKLGMSYDEAVAATGADLVTTGEFGGCAAIQYTAGAGTATALVPSDSGMVSLIETPDGTRTDRGARDGDPLDVLQQLYGQTHSIGVMETQAGSAAYVTTRQNEVTFAAGPGLIGFFYDGVSLGPPTVGGIPGFEYCSGA